MNAYKYVTVARYPHEYTADRTAFHKTFEGAQNWAEGNAKDKPGYSGYCQVTIALITETLP